MQETCGEVQDTVYSPIQPRMGLPVVSVVQMKLVLGPHSSYRFGRRMCWWPGLQRTAHRSVLVAAITHTKPPFTGSSRSRHEFLAVEQKISTLRAFLHQAHFFCRNHLPPGLTHCGIEGYLFSFWYQRVP